MARKKAEIFLKKASQFHLGVLPTEQRHPETFNLAQLAQENPQEALDILQRIDLQTLEKVRQKEKEIERLSAAIADTFASGGRVFLYGCGATGRLSLSLEYIWRFMHQKNQAAADQVIGFMSGGDLALVHSIENFEDHPEFGARQVKELGFGKNDLLISTTEGGETPSVIGATEEAVKRSKRKPWFLYCNPEDLLKAKVERSRKVIENPQIEKINLFVGNMSLSGSTRLQATTALMLAAGAALVKNAVNWKGPPLDLSHFIDFFRQLDTSFLAPFVAAESAAYKKGEFLLYETDYYAITIMTDTTERAPTFSLAGFENQREPKSLPSLSYLSLPKAKNAKEAWRKILLRDPIALEWKPLLGRASSKRLWGFDFSKKIQDLRKKKLKNKKQHLFQIHHKAKDMDFRFGNIRHKIDISALHPLVEHILLKLLLNAHSTLVMGRMGRFESNVMTWVRPSNNKLIDRAIRYVDFLLSHHKIKKFSYEEIAYQLFAETESLKADESVVLKTFESLKNVSKGLH